MAIQKSKLKSLVIFRAGRHVDSSGVTRSFSEADVAATVAAYDPASHEAPIVIGHPRTDAPAWGWIGQLTATADGGLVAQPRQVDPMFAELVAAGRYKKVSASFYLPDAPSNPKSGAYYLRHVGFLGAQPPAIKGLGDAAFKEDEEGVISMEFGELNSRGVGRIFRSMREWIIEKFGPEDADRAVPGWIVEAVENDAVQPDDNAPLPTYQEIEDMPDDQATAARVAELQKHEDALRIREAAFTEREKSLQAAESAECARRCADFAETLVKDGKILPRQKESIATLLVGMEGQASMEFAEGGKAVQAKPAQKMREFLSDLQARVDFQERTAADGETPTSASFSAPDGYSIDPDGLKAHRKILAYATANSIDYVTAAMAVGG